MKSLIADIFHSFMALPHWVKIWVFVILVPVNFASILFLSEPGGTWIAILAIGAILCNLPVLLIERGFSNTMALPHLIPWTILVAWLLFWRPDGSEIFVGYLWLVLVVDAISLVFDYPDAFKWYKGERKVAGSN